MRAVADTDPTAVTVTEGMREWAKCLRGEITQANGQPYEQAKATLRTSDGKFCCLGVANDRFGAGHWRDVDLDDPVDYAEAYGVYIEDDRTYVGVGLSPATVHALFEGTDTTQTRIDVLRSMAAGKNDGGTSFADIAAWIESGCPLD